MLKHIRKMDIITDKGVNFDEYTTVRVLCASCRKAEFYKSCRGVIYFNACGYTSHKKSGRRIEYDTIYPNIKVRKLTETGALFYGEAKDILQKMAMAEKKVKKLASQNLAVLRIGCSSQVEIDTLEQPLRSLKELLPDVFPQVIIQDYFSLKSLFDNGQLDILIGTKK